MFLQRLAPAIVAILLLTTPASAQEIEGVLQIDPIPTAKGDPGENIAFEVTVERFCPPGYVAEAAQATLHVEAPDGFQVTADPLTFDQQICAVENPQTSSARLTVTVLGDAERPLTHLFTVDVVHPDQALPYPPMTYGPAQTEFAITLEAADDEADMASEGSTDGSDSIGIPSLGAAPLLVALAAAAVLLRRL